MLVAEATLEGLITEFLTEIVVALQANLSTNNRNATGASSASIKLANITESGGQVVGSSSIQWVFTGRGPGGFPPISKIIDWLNARGLPRSAAWAIATVLAREGSKLYRAGGRDNNGLTETLTPERIAEFSKNISVLLAQDFVSDIKGIFP